MSVPTVPIAVRVAVLAAAATLCLAALAPAVAQASPAVTATDGATPRIVGGQAATHLSALLDPLGSEESTASVVTWQVPGTDPQAPVPVPTGLDKSSLLEVASEGSRMVALYRDGTAWWWTREMAWGQPSWLSQGPLSTPSAPDVAASPVTKISGGASFITTGADVYRWPTYPGVLSSDSLNAPPPLFDPTAPRAPYPARGTAFVDVKGNDDAAVALTDAGYVVVGQTGRNGAPSGPYWIPRSLWHGGVIAIDSDGSDAAAVTADGVVHLWGLGLDIPEDADELQVPGLCPAAGVRVYAGAALCRDGTVDLWTAAPSWLRDGNAPGVMTPPADLKDVKDIWITRDYGLALTNSGQVRTWGQGQGQVPELGDGVSSLSVVYLGIAVRPHVAPIRAATYWHRPDGAWEVRWTPSATPSADAVAAYEVLVPPATTWRRVSVLPSVDPPTHTFFTGITIDPGAAVQVRPVYRPAGSAETVPGPAVRAVLIDRPIRYAAIGDSYSAGEGNPPYQAGTAVEGNRCHRSATAYAYRIADRLGGPAYVDLTFEPCSGALSRDVLLANVSNRDVRPQLQTVPPDADLVTLTMGGNDMGFGAVADWCIDSLSVILHDLQGKPTNCAQAIVDGTFPLPSADVPHLVTVMNAVRRRAGAAKVVALGYPQAVSDPAHWTSWHGLPMTVGGKASPALVSPENAVQVRQYVQEMNDAVQQAALLSGVAFVHMAAAFGEHTLDGTDPWFTPITVPLLNVDRGKVLAPDQQSLHPTALGQKKYADQFAASVSDIDGLPATAPAATLANEAITPLGDQPGQDVPAFQEHLDGTVTMCAQTFAGLTAKQAEPGGALVQIEEQEGARWNALSKNDDRVLTESWTTDGPSMLTAKDSDETLIRDQLLATFCWRADAHLTGTYRWALDRTKLSNPAYTPSFSPAAYTRLGELGELTSSAQGDAWDRGAGAGRAQLSYGHSGCVDVNAAGYCTAGTWMYLPGAHWIWPSGASTDSQPITFTKFFTATKAQAGQRYDLQIAATGSYTAALNGVAVGSGTGAQTVTHLAVRPRAGNNKLTITISPAQPSEQGRGMAWLLRSAG